MGCASSSAKEATESRSIKEGDAPDGEEDFLPLTQEEVNARIQCSDGVQHFKLGETGVSLRYAYLSQRGYYPEDLYKSNQDAFKVVPSFNGNKNAMFFGIFDGHGQDGDHCSYFVRDNIEAALKHKMKVFPNDFERAYKESFIEVNKQMHNQSFDDSMSGTTAITAYFDGLNMTIANIGDSRAVVGERQGKRLMASSLSLDQTPYRADERERVKAAGAVVMSCDQLEGIVPFHENWGVNLGEELDNGGDPPRVWAPGQSYPGCAFTRSVGDAVAETIGVTAEPELNGKRLGDNDEFVILASDGVWEFLTNQSVADMVSKFSDPLEACRAIVAESYRLWLQYEIRTDDITIILAFLDRLSAAESPAAVAESAAGVSHLASIDGGENRPVRRGLSKEKKKALTIAMTAVSEEHDTDFEMEVVPKTAEELSRLATAVKANFLFSHLNEVQANHVFDVMKRVEVKPGEVVIRQGDEGDWFYVVEKGEYSVTISSDGKAPVEILKYSTAGGTNPCFGELALMYSKPRAATVTATTEGELWAMDRRSFRAILMKSSAGTLTRTLRSVGVFSSLKVGQLQRLEDVLTEVSFDEGEAVCKEGDEGASFYIITQGRAKCTSEAKGLLMELGTNQYFGERALLNSEPRAATVTALTKLKCLYISKDAFEEVLGSLQAIIDADRQWREKISLEKQQQQHAEGLAGIAIDSFVLQGATATSDASQYVLVDRKQGEGSYTIKCMSKAKVVELNLQQRVRNEKEWVTMLTTSNRFVPLALATISDADFLYIVCKTRIAMDLHHALERLCDESQVKFYAASLVLALEHLHSQNVVYRNLSPDAVLLDEAGYVQLLDFRFAFKAGEVQKDFCGAAHYLSPEQVQGSGHDLAVDSWSLGICLYELLTGDAPWLTGDPVKDTEVSIFSKITSHVEGSVSFPSDCPLSEAGVGFVNGLLHPEPAKRLGRTAGGFAELRLHPWFCGFEWSKLREGSLAAPHAAVAKAAVEKAAAGKLELAAESFKGDQSWFASF